jgi:hypothetical protein
MERQGFRSLIQAPAPGTTDERLFVYFSSVASSGLPLTIMRGDIPLFHLLVFLTYG